MHTLYVRHGAFRWLLFARSEIIVGAHDCFASMWMVCQLIGTNFLVELVWPKRTQHTDVTRTLGLMKK